MQDQTWRRSVQPQHPKIKEETFDLIKNSLLGYNFTSQFYIDIPDKSELNIILFLCLYNHKTMKSKKMNSLLAKINQNEREELEQQFFNTHNQRQGLDIAKVVEQLSSKFTFHEKLIKDHAPLFNTLNLNSLLQHDQYKDKLQMRQLVSDKLIPIKDASYSSKRQLLNDIILIQYDNGFYLAFYSKKSKAENSSSIDKGLERQAEQQKRGMEIDKKSQQEQKIEKAIHQPIMKKQSMKKQVNEIEDRKKDKMEDQYCSIVLIIMLIYLLTIEGLKMI